MFDNFIDSLTDIATQTNQNLVLLFSVLGILFAIHCVNCMTGQRLLNLGLVPRRLRGLIGIITSPFLHANFNHLFFNAVPLFILLDFVCIYSPDHWILITVYITLIGGLLTWLFARRAIHVGASGLISGYWGYLVFNMYEQTSVTSIILGIVSVYYFAGIFFGIFPSEKSTSWEGHLFGLAAGVFVAWQIQYLLDMTQWLSALM